MNCKRATLDKEGERERDGVRKKSRGKEEVREREKIITSCGRLLTKISQTLIPDSKGQKYDQINDLTLLVTKYHWANSKLFLFPHISFLKPAFDSGSKKPKLVLAYPVPSLVTALIKPTYRSYAWGKWVRTRDFESIR